MELAPRQEGPTSIKHRRDEDTRDAIHGAVGADRQQDEAEDTKAATHEVVGEVPPPFLKVTLSI
jgi:hypothetical protein